MCEKQLCERRSGRSLRNGQNNLKIARVQTITALSRVFHNRADRRTRHSIQGQIGVPIKQSIFRRRETFCQFTQSQQTIQTNGKQFVFPYDPNR